ncbi:hypothetical protein N8I71_08065 [Roseibacterium sp. SDUM158016]|uniref:hypothetical protein n=1 Tax=Roseicyclus sediminis TaxID=2980997 RepID=UPI0021D21E03|nr:hypothetical protein [Roseibacterium sp. SDUM158016]MCU4652784.1 hypothetical protein [Roseibacterium sp. SDUM158016]
MTRTSRLRTGNGRIALKYTSLFLFGVMMTAIVYNTVLGLVAVIVMATSGSIAWSELPARYWNDWIGVFFVGREEVNGWYTSGWEYFVWMTTFMASMMMPVLIFSVVAWPLIYWAKDPDRRARRLVIPYLVLYAANVALIAVGISHI